MASQITTFHLNYVSSHINQTSLVYDLLERAIFSYDDIENFFDPETDATQEVFQWLTFPNFWEIDYERLVSAKIPVLDTEYGIWVGITSYGSPYSLYVYPELINALFDLSISYKDIYRISRC